VRGFLTFLTIVLASIGIGAAALDATGNQSIPSLPKITSTAFPYNDQFSSIISDGSVLKLFGPTGPQPDRCIYALVATENLHRSRPRTFNCNSPFAELPKSQLVTAVTSYANTPRTEVRIARRNTTSRRVSYGPVVMRFEDASNTHLEQIYGGGSLWVFDAATPQGALLLRVSPTTGSVENRIVVPDQPFRPILAANKDGLWMEVAVNGGFDYATPSNAPIYHVAPGANSATVVHRGGRAALWIAASDHTAWVDESIFHPGKHGGFSESLLRFEGPKALLVSQKDVTSLAWVTATADLSGDLWATVIPERHASSCKGTQDVVRFDSRTGRGAKVALLPQVTVWTSIPYACELFGMNTASTFLGGALYVLYDGLSGGYTRLYRIAK